MKFKNENMKKLLLSFFTVCAITLLAQPVIVTNYSGDTLNSGTYLAIGDQMDIDTAKLITYLSNDFNENKDVSVSRYNLDKCDGTENYFCWALCYQPAITDMNPFLAPDKISMTPGLADSSFSAYHKPEGETGNAKYRFVWKVKGEADSVYVDVEFQITGSCEVQSLNEDNFSTINIYPNPANEIINIKTDKKDNYRVELVNILGKEVLNKNIQNSDFTTVNTSNFNPGIYFARIYSNNKLIESRKITVN